MTCKCRNVFEQHDSIGSQEGLCQTCWEALCANLWWKGTAMLTGWKYWWNRYIGWFPFQPCRICWRWYWGGLPMAGWQASYKEYCSKRCYDVAGGGLY